MNNQEVKKEKEVVLPVGKGNKNLSETYEDKKTIPFHSVSEISLKLESVDSAQLQAWGQRN